MTNKRQPSPLIEKLQVDDKEYQQPSTISNHLTKFFAMFLLHNHDCPNPVGRSPPISLRKEIHSRFSKVDSELEVYLLREGLDTKESLGNEKVHPRLLKTAVLQIYIVP